jgi:hypothetical protein
MKLNLLKTLMIFFISLVFGFTTINGSNTAKAQSLFRVNDVPGGGGSGSSSSSIGQSSGTTLFIIFGVAVAALVAYKYLIADNSGNNDKGKSDSTSTGSLLRDFPEIHTASSQFQKLSHKLQDLPMNFYVGIRNNYFDLRKKTLVLGMKIKI